MSVSVVADRRSTPARRRVSGRGAITLVIAALTGMLLGSLPFLRYVVAHRHAHSGDTVKGEHHASRTD